MLACPPGDPELQAELEERANTFIKRHIDEYVAAGGGARKPSFVVEFVKGRAQRTLGAKICRISEALNAAVVVVAGHKAANVFEEWLMGSVSRHVATNCRQPTLVYPPFSSWPRG